MFNLATISNQNYSLISNNKPHIQQHIHHHHKTRLNASSSSTKMATVTVPYTVRLTEKIFSKIEAEESVGGAGGSNTYEALKAADRLAQSYRNPSSNIKLNDNFITTGSKALEFIDFDVIVAGGTLGIFLACALQKSGLRVAIVERGILKGRAQEWNISRKELYELKRQGILTEKEIEMCIESEWDKVRVGFHNGSEIWTNNVLNIGVSPEKLIEICRRKFLANRGVVCQQITLLSLSLHQNGIQLRLNPTGQDKIVDCTLNTKLLIDCMGNQSPIVQEIRRGQKPDGICQVVGTLSSGFEKNDYSDLIYTNSPIQTNGITGKKIQYFWEAFPAAGTENRTTYMFSYLDTREDLPGLEEMFEDYWRLMPEYQNINLNDLKFKRALFGVFPTYRDSPLKPAFDRILHVGDAGGLQSPLSFGGFGAMLRHLGRLKCAVKDAMNARIVDRESLAKINPYNPGISTSWMFQQVMCAQEDTPPDFINMVLSNNFNTMQSLGDTVLKPFLQDVVQFKPLTLTLMLQIVKNPGFLMDIYKVIGVNTLLNWIPHFFNLGMYTAFVPTLLLMRFIARNLPPRDSFRFERFLDGIEYGSGLDYNKH